MTDNHLLLYRLAELMLEHEQHILPVDLLFDDDKIGDFVKSIQIDSPYQQMLIEGVLTESVKDEKLFVSFTVEGYFHYVLGEVIFKQTEGKAPNSLKDIFDNKKFNGIREGIEQCLLRDVQKDILHRLMWLIDCGGDLSGICSLPLAFSFLNIKGHIKTEQELHHAYNTQITKIFNELFSQTSENYFKTLEAGIKKLETLQNYQVYSLIYKEINKRIKPDNYEKTLLYFKSINHIDHKQKLIKLKNLINHLNKTKVKNNYISSYYYEIGNIYSDLNNFKDSLLYLNKSLNIDLRLYGLSSIKTAITYSSIASVLNMLGIHDKALKYYKKALYINTRIHHSKHTNNAIYYDGIGKFWELFFNYKKAIYYYNKSFLIRNMNFGYYHPDTGYSLNSIARVLQAKGENLKALKLYNKTLTIYLKIYGKENYSIAQSYINIGSIYENKGEYNNALFHYRIALDITIKIYGEIHTTTAMILSLIGSALEGIKNHDEALENYTKSLNVFLHINGNKHPSVAGIYYYIGLIYNKKEDHNQALIFFNKSYNIFLKVLGRRHSIIKNLEKEILLLNDL